MIASQIVNTIMLKLHTILMLHFKKKLSDLFHNYCLILVCYVSFRCAYMYTFFVNGIHVQFVRL